MPQVFWLRPTHMSISTPFSICPCKNLLILETSSANSSMSAFYNEVMTFNETDVTATCCKLDGAPISTVCGRGFSCAASCFSLEASLCPSHNCEACDDLEEQPQRRQGAGNSIATQGSISLGHCTRNGCRVGGRFKGCCFHPQCQSKRKRQCSWLHYLVGKKFLERKFSDAHRFPHQVTNAHGLVMLTMASGNAKSRTYLSLKVLT